jgi:hypothetical protein
VLAAVGVLALALPRGRPADPAPPAVVAAAPSPTSPAAAPSVPTPAPAPARATGTVRFASDPPGARVSLDGQILGTTPFEQAMALGPTARSFAFRLDGYAEAVVQAIVTGDVPVAARLEPLAVPAAAEPDRVAPASKVAPSASRRAPSAPKPGTDKADSDYPVVW